MNPLEENSMDNINTYNLDTDKDYSWMSLMDFLTGDYDFDEKCFIISDGVKYLVNDGYSVKDFIDEYNADYLSEFYDMKGEADIEKLLSSSGFIEIARDKLREEFK